MQATLLHNMTVQCNNITEITPAIIFDCVVDGKKRRASITHQEDNGLQLIYHISFSDGYTASFVASMQAGGWHRDAVSSLYAVAIQDDLNAFCGFYPKKPPFCIRLKNEKEVFNVWIVPHVFKANHYSIFYKGDYRFDLRKTKNWEACSVREGTFINEEIAALVCQNIEERTQLPFGDRLQPSFPFIID